MQLSAPETLFLEITTECNYRCRYCHMWMTKDDPAQLTTLEKMRVVEEFAETSPTGQVVFTGGEVMRKFDELITLAKRCREVSLSCATNTNGSLVERIDDLLTYGPNHLVVSVDSHREDVHDFSRGINGSHAYVTRVIRDLLRRRKELNLEAHTLIFINSVVFDRNIGLLEGLLKFATHLGVDGLTLQMLGPTFHRRSKADVFFRDHFFSDRPAAIDHLQQLIEIASQYPVLRTSARDLQWMQKYIVNPDFSTEAVCGSHERNMMINTKGEVQLCFSMKKLLGGRTLGNVRDHSVQRLWLSEAANAARSAMADCRYGCGMLNCHRKH